MSGEPSERNGGSSASGSAEGSSSTPGRRRASAVRTLDDVMREPSTTVPDVIVLDSLHEGSRRHEALDPREDLWLSTADGRYSSPIIPLRVGEAPYLETFYVHKHILLKSEYFERALCGKFSESDAQSIDLPEENPAIFHFLVAYLYEGRYEPIKPAALVLVPDEDKGKGHATAETGAESDSDSDSSFHSDVSALSRRRHERRRRREQRHWEHVGRKHPGTHRPNCNCPQCVTPSCWSCRAPRNPPPHAHAPAVVIDRDYGFGRVPDRRPHAPPRARPPRRRHGNPGQPPPLPRPLTPPPGWATDPNGGRIAGDEDLRTWLLAYELNLDVYLLANKFLLEGLKREIARATVDMLESAGSDAAALPELVFLCRKLYDGLPESDPLLKMVCARVGFLQPWRRHPGDINAFLLGNPDIATLLLREMAARREDDLGGRALPSMVRPWYAAALGGPDAGGSFRGPPPPPPGVAGNYGVHGPGPGRQVWRGW